MTTETPDVNLDFSKTDEQAGEKTGRILMEELKGLSYEDAGKAIANTSQEKLLEMLNSVNILDCIKAIGQLQEQINTDRHNFLSLLKYVEGISIKIDKAMEILNRRLGRVEAETLDTHTRLQ